jgi:hypothetical protein
VDTLLSPGCYEVYVWKFAHPFSHMMATDAPFRVRSTGGMSGLIQVDQSTGGDEWIYLGNFEFDDSCTQGVAVTNNANGHVIADAIRLVRIKSLNRTHAEMR